MTFVLILVVLGGDTASADNLQRPLIVGQFESLQDCKDAATGAQFIKAGKFAARGYSGAEFVCVRGK